MHLRCHVGRILGLQLIHKSMKSTCSMQRSSHGPLHFVENYIGPINLVLCTSIYVSIDIVVVQSWSFALPKMSFLYSLR
jgi:hypothetical protein